MANLEVNLTKCVRLNGCKRYYPVPLTANGRIKLGCVLVNGKEEPCPPDKGRYYLDWYEGRRRIRRSVGKDPAQAYAQRLRKEAELNARKHGVAVAAPTQKTSSLLEDAIHDFLAEKQAHRKKKTHVDYVVTLGYFKKSCPKLYLADVTRQDLLNFIVYCRDELELSPRTIFNKFARVVAFLAANKIKLHERGDAPKFVEEDPEIYEHEDLDTLFAKCSAAERVWYEFFLMTGMREQEVCTATGAM